MTDPAASISRLLDHATALLADAGIADARVDAELLIAHAIGGSRGEVQAAAMMGRTASAAQAESIAQFLRRRAAREPLQHITGVAPFRHLELAVGQGVFVPRPETELLVQLAIDALVTYPDAAPIAVDLGAGSGAIGLAIATEVPHASVRAVERSADAIAWTRRNADRVGAPNYAIELGDLATALSELDGTVSVIASNPPYVPDDAIPRDPEVRLHDPSVALYGGADGLNIVRQVSATGLRLGRPGALVVIEHGEWQGAAIRELLAADGWRTPATHQDLTMRDRVTTAHHPA